MNGKHLFLALIPALALLLASVFFVNSSLSAPVEQLAPQGPDLAITKSASPNPVLLGNRLTYSVLIRNVSTGNVKLASVTMTDTLPSGVAFASVSTTKGQCQQASGKIQCLIGTLNKNGRATVTIVVTPTVTGIITNSAAAATSSNDTNLSNNSATITTTVNPKADLSISKIGVPATVLAGDQLAYTLVVTNAGPSNATNVFVTDTLPLNVAFNSATAGCAVLSNVVTCGVGSLANGGTRTLTITVVPSALVAGTVVNQAVVSGSEADPVTANNTASAINTVNPKTDLAVSQASAPAPALLGNLLNYTVTVTNNGPSAASSILLTDVLPSNVTFSSASASCASTVELVTCSSSSIAAGGTVTFTISVIPGQLGLITNTVSTTGAQFDPNLSNNVNSASTSVIPAADLLIVKTTPASLHLAGQPLTYTIAITNNGPSNATSVVMTDTLPAGVTLAASPGTCNGTSVIVCSIGALNSGGFSSITLIVTPTDTGAVTNTATVNSELADPNLVNNTTVLRTAVNPVDLSVRKYASSGLLNSNEPLTYTIIVTNNGPLPGTGVRLTDTLPANVIIGAITSSLGTTCTSTNVFICSLDGLDLNASATVTVNVTPTATGILVNNVVVSANEPDPNLADNVASATTLINSTDLILKKTAAPSPAYVGSLLTYTLVVSDSGPLPATGVVVTDSLPANVLFSSASAGCNLAVNQVVLCSIGAVSVGSSRTVTIAVTPGVAAVGTITNTATVGSDQPESTLTDSSATVQTIVQDSADLSITKTAEPNLIYAGTLSFYMLTVKNDGPSTATQVVVTDTLPAGVTFSTATPGCLNTNGTVTCTIGTLPSGSFASLLVSTTPTAAAAGLITNTASVAATEHDPNPANNTATAGTTVIPLADLAVTKIALPDPAQSGSPLTYTLRVTNTGPSNATNVVVTDTLPVLVTFNSASGSCGQASGIVTCTVGQLAAGASKSISISVTPQFSATGTYIENIVEAASSVLDTDLSNNLFVLDTAIDPVDLAVVKTGEPNPVFIHAKLTYTLIVTNYGPAGATGVILFDTLPASVTFSTASSGCINTASLVTCNLPDLSAGLTNPVTITVIPTSIGLITNSAFVDANEADNNLTNDNASVNTNVVPYRLFLPIIRR